MELYEQCRQIQETALGTDDPSCTITLGNMALCLGSQGRYSEAMELHEQCRQIRETALGKQHPDYLAVLKSMSQLCRAPAISNSRTIAVLVQLEEALTLQKVKQNQDWIDTVQELVGLLVDEGRMEEAQRYMDGRSGGT